MKGMNKKILMVLTALLLMIGSLQAQIFIADDEFEGSLRRGESEFVLVAPLQGTNADQFTPVGNGVLVMTGLGIAYLLAKRKKQK